MMSKRLSGGLREENYEHVLMCLICRSLFDDYDHQPKFLPCHHTFCKDCLREYVKQTGDEIECPSCRKIATIPTAGVVALQTNFYVKYIQSLVYGPSGAEGTSLECDIHPHAKLLYYCKECTRSICNKCCEGDGKVQCTEHKKVPLTAVTEEYNQKLDSAFSKANGAIERKKVELEAMMKDLSEEKDQAMRKIESTFEQHVHTLSRRATLLKNKVIAIYNEYLEKLEGDLEEISTALTCIISLKEYHENMIGKGYFIDIHKGIAEMDEVHINIKSRIQPKENHIIFEEKHGVEKFKVSAKDLGRVKSSRPTLPRSEPEGNDATCTEGAGGGGNPLSPGTPANLQSDGEFASPTGYEAGFAAGSDNQGAVGGATASETTFKLHAEADCSPDEPVLNMSGSMHRSTKGSRCDTGGNSSSASRASHTQLNAHGHSALENTKLDINCNTPITVPGVVRPKTLSGSTSTSSASVKDNVQNGLIKRSIDKRDTTTKSGSAENKYSLKVGDRSSKALDPDIENLKQADKMYHHLVYTSYDEEELLKELKCGKVHFDATTRVGGTGGPAQGGPAERPPQKNMEDSDGWMTVSSDSTISCNSEEGSEQSRL